MVYKVNEKVLSDVIWRADEIVREFLFDKYATKGFYHDGIGPYTLEDVSVTQYILKFKEGEGINLLRIKGKYELQGYIKFGDELRYASKEGRYEALLPFTKSGKPLYNFMYIKLNEGSYEKI